MFGFFCVTKLLKWRSNSEVGLLSLEMELRSFISTISPFKLGSVACTFGIGLWDFVEDIVVVMVGSGAVFK